MNATVLKTVALTQVVANRPRHQCTVKHFHTLSRSSVNIILLLGTLLMPRLHHCPERKKSELYEFLFRPLRFQPSNNVAVTRDSAYTFWRKTLV